MNIKSTLLGVALGLVSAVAANATTLTLINPPSQSDIPYEVVFQATGPESEVLVSGYQIPAFEYLTQNTVTLLAGGANLLGQTWAMTTTEYGSQFNDGSSVNGIGIGSVVPSVPDTFLQSFATVSGDLYAYKFNFSNDSVATPSGLTVTFSAAAPEASTWVMMLAGFAGLGFVGYRRNKAANFAA